MSFIHNEGNNSGASRDCHRHPQPAETTYPLEVIIELVDELRPNDGPKKDTNDGEQVKCWTEDSGWSILWDNDLNTSRYSVRTHDHQRDHHSITLLKQFQDHSRKILSRPSDDSNNEIDNSSLSALEGQSNKHLRSRKSYMVEF
jgi:hypothetical protein